MEVTTPADALSPSDTIAAKFADDATQLTPTVNGTFRPLTNSSADHHQAEIFMAYVTMGAFLPFSTFVNVVGIAVLRKNAYLTSITNILTMGISACDLLAIWFSFYPYCIGLVLNVRIISLNRFTCKSIFFIRVVLSVTSTWLLVNVSFERLFIVTHLVSTTGYRYRRKVWLAVNLIQITTIALTYSPLIYGMDLTDGICQPLQFFKPHFQAFLLADTLIYSIIPSCIFVVNGTIIANCLVKFRSSVRPQTNAEAATNQPARANQQSQNSKTISLFLMTTLFMATSLPTTLYGLLKPDWLAIESVEERKRQYLIMGMLYQLTFVNSAGNIICLFATSSGIRRDVKKLPPLKFVCNSA